MFYKLAREHKQARLLDLEGLFYELGENFNLAKGYLNFVSRHYLEFKKGKLFNLGSA